MTRWIDVIRGEADDHQQMLTILDEANQHLSFAYETPAGEVTSPAVWTQERAATASEVSGQPGLTS